MAVYFLRIHLLQHAAAPFIIRAKSRINPDAYHAEKLFQAHSQALENMLLVLLIVAFKGQWGR